MAATLLWERKEERATRRTERSNENTQERRRQRACLVVAAVATKRTIVDDDAANERGKECVHAVYQIQNSQFSMHTWLTGHSHCATVEQMPTTAETHTTKNSSLVKHNIPHKIVQCVEALDVRGPRIVHLRWQRLHVMGSMSQTAHTVVATRRSTRVIFPEHKHCG